MTKMPVQKPGRSKQDYGTPRGFIEAVEARLKDTFGHDLAASKENTVCENFYDEERNSLTVNWAEETKPCWCWLNPPFENIEPWVKKCWEESQKGAQIACLVPCSIAEWWQRWVDGKCYINLLHGRITFVGEAKPYPKDCALLLYTPWGMKGSEVWAWKAK